MARFRIRQHPLTPHTVSGCCRTVIRMNGRLIIRYVGGPWHDTVWTPANPDGILAAHRAEGWSGHYLRHSLDAAGAWRYRWIPDVPEARTA